MGAHTHQNNRQPLTGEWQTSLVRCTPCGPFRTAVACPWIVYGQTAQRLRNPTVQPPIHKNDCIEFAFCIALAGCFFPLGDQRAEIRRRYGIKGNEASDFCESCCCCYACALLQHEEEVKARLAAEKAAPAAAAVNKEGYQPQKPMRAKVNAGKQRVGGAGPPQLKAHCGYRVQEPMGMKLDAARARVTVGDEGSQRKEQRRRSF